MACVLVSILPNGLWAQPTQVDSSDIIPAGGETPNIVYYRYVERGYNAPSVSVFRFIIRDGGVSAPDSDPFPTVIDSLVIHVNLVGNGPLHSTLSLNWAGLVTVGPNPQLIAPADIRDSEL